jgi:hypothetical protein
MANATNRWGIELSGQEEDKKAWRILLKPPFDPFVEEVEDERSNYLALRSSAFDGIATSQKVNQTAKQLFITLNVAISQNADTDPVANGAVVEFMQDGKPRRHYFLEAEGTEFRMRFNIATLEVRDTRGMVLESPPSPSRSQQWMRAAALKPEIGSALRYLYGKPGWFELYKAYEAVQNMPNGGISSSEIRRFKQTANVGKRHHPNNKNKPHDQPMELWEARAFITQMVSAAIKDILAKNP